MSKAYSYIRFSSAEQAKGRSKTRQEEQCAAYCAKEKLDLATEDEYKFFDAGKSGFRGEHLEQDGQLARFIRLVKDGTIERGSTLIVESLDRLDRRSVLKALPQFMDLLESGIQIVTLTDQRRYSEHVSDYELFGSFMIMSRAHEESATKAKRVRDAMRAKHKAAREHGKVMGRMIPHWLTVKDGKIVKIEDRVDTVKLIFQLAADGKGRGKIAKRLNADKVANFGAYRQLNKGKPISGWGTSSIAKILANEAVLGRYQPMSVQDTKDGKRAEAGDPIENYYPQIIETELFEQVRGFLKQRRVKGSGGTKQSESINIWQSIAKCVHCGTAMHLVNRGDGKGGLSIRCYQARKGLCEGKAVRLDQSEAVFSGMLARLDALSLVTEDSGQTIKQIAALDGRLVSKLNHLAQLTQFQNDPDTASKTNAKQIAVLEREIETTEQEKQKLQTAVTVATVTSMSLDEFQAKVDLVTPDGREKANTLLTRLGVLVHIGREEGYLVSQNGRIAFGMAFQNGQAGYLCTVWNKAPEGQELHKTAATALKVMASMGEFIPANDAGVSAYADHEEAAQAAYDALKPEGQVVASGEY